MIEYPACPTASAPAASAAVGAPSTSTPSTSAPAKPQMVCVLQCKNELCKKRYAPNNPNETANNHSCGNKKPSFFSGVKSQSSAPPQSSAPSAAADVPGDDDEPVYVGPEDIRSHGGVVRKSVKWPSEQHDGFVMGFVHWAVRSNVSFNSLNDELLHSSLGGMGLKLPSESSIRKTWLPKLADMADEINMLKLRKMAVGGDGDDQDQEIRIDAASTCHTCRPSLHLPHLLTLSLPPRPPIAMCAHRPTAS
jgi:hypothetical protein